MFGAAVVSGLTYFAMPRLRETAPLTKSAYTRRLKSLDRNVVIGGGIFGVGWGLSGICPGAAYASLGVGNLVMVYGIFGMFVGAYIQGALRSTNVTEATTETAGD